MAEKREDDSIDEFEKALAQDDVVFCMRLYVAGATHRSQRAIDNIKAFCARYLKGRHELEIVDIYQNQERLKDESVIAAPTLVKQLPPPIRRLIGDMSDEERILIGLGIRKAKSKDQSCEDND